MLLRRDGSLEQWKFVVVADEVPDPGEGYRLLKKLEYDGEEEEITAGDEYWNNGWHAANLFCLPGGKQSSKIHYRRRIDPEKPVRQSAKIRRPGVGDWVIVKEDIMHKGVPCFSEPFQVLEIRDSGEFLQCLLNGDWIDMWQCILTEPPEQQPDLEVEPKLAVDSVIDSPFVTDAAKHIFSALLSNPNVIVHNPNCGWSICNATSSQLAIFAWELARDLEFARSVKETEEKGEVTPCG